MLISGPQVTALAEFADGGEIVLLSAIFDPNVHPENLWILRDDGVQVTIARDGTIKPWTEADTPLLADPERRKALQAYTKNDHLCPVCGEPAVSPGDDCGKDSCADQLRQQELLNH